MNMVTLSASPLSPRHCRIVATVGPATNLLQLLQAGVSAFRVNFSHGEYEVHRQCIAAIRAAEEQAGRLVPIIADLQGPKIRTGKFAEGPITLRYGQELTLEASDEPGHDGLIRLPHADIMAVLQPGDVLKLDDGTMQITLTEKLSPTQARAVVDIGGTLSDRKGINIPTRQLPISAMTTKDKRDMEFALGEGVDYIALSFVQSPEDVAEAKVLINGRAKVLSKIEKPLALESIDDIIALSDAVMVARGDLGVELPMEQVPLAQRKIVKRCRRAGKPVIVATQMLQSMVDTPVPTRAEASDVATAVYMGADAVMLSAESAVGKHPATAVAVMDRIIRAVEADPNFWEDLYSSRKKPQADAANALSASARDMARLLGSAAIFAFTRSGSTAMAVARQRPCCPVYALTPDKAAARQLALVWGVTPAISPDLNDSDAMFHWAETHALQQGWLKPSDQAIALAGAPFGTPGTTNMLKILTAK